MHQPPPVPPQPGQQPSVPPPHIAPEPYDPYDRSGRRQRRTVIVTIAAIVAVLVAGGGVYAVGEAVRQDSREMVEAYMEALVVGDAAAANALASTSAPESLPAPDSLADAERISSYAIGEGVPTGVTTVDDQRYEGMRYDVEYVLDGATIETRVIVEDLGGWWIQQRWAIRDALVQEVQLRPSSSVSEISATLAGAEVDVLQPQLLGTVPPVLLYPGVYDLEVESTSLLDATSVLDLAVTEATWVEVVATPGQAAFDLAADTVIDDVAACIAATDDRYVSCDRLSVFSDAPRDADVAWTFEGDPTTTAAEPTWAFDVSTTLVATYVDEAGVTVEERFPLEAYVSLYEVRPDEAQAAVGWWQDR